MCPNLRIVYGGVLPTNHWADILKECDAINVIVRSEGEDTIVRLKHALGFDASLDSVNGIACRREGIPHAIQAAETIVCLDNYRIG